MYLRCMASSDMHTGREAPYISDSLWKISYQKIYETSYVDDILSPLTRERFY